MNTAERFSNLLGRAANRLDGNIVVHGMTPWKDERSDDHYYPAIFFAAVRKVIPPSNVGLSYLFQNVRHKQAHGYLTGLIRSARKFGERKYAGNPPWAGQAPAPILYQPAILREMELFNVLKENRAGVAGLLKAVVHLGDTEVTTYFHEAPYQTAISDYRALGYETALTTMRREVGKAKPFDDTGTVFVVLLNQPEAMGKFLQPIGLETIMDSSRR